MMTNGKQLHHLCNMKRISQLSTCRHSLEFNDQDRVCPTGCGIPWQKFAAGMQCYSRLKSGTKLW